MLRWLLMVDRDLKTRVRRAVRQIDSKSGYRPWDGMTPGQVFSRIYERRLWGGKTRFFSGIGSHQPEVVGPYVAAIRQWMEGQGALDAVDLGCGDFHVGAQVRPLFRGYTACDVVPELIAHHQAGPHAASVTFRCLDIARDPLPEGDVVFIRQVLQHLPNAMIGALVPRLYAFRWLVLTEHLPFEPDFVPNVDLPLGPDIRVPLGSGVDLCAPPFNLLPKDTRILCEVPQTDGIIRTTLYRLAT